MAWGMIRKRRQKRVVNSNRATDSEESRQLLSATLQLTRMSETIKTVGELAAYIILGLTNKEIAAMINRQPRTVETIKYRLRKSLCIPADIRTDEWLKRYLPLRDPGAFQTGI